MPPKPFSKELSKRSGQSLLEMMIALSVLTVAFLGIGALLSRSFFLNRVATDETIGSYLAAEGVEVTKSIIDHDMYSTGLGWGVDVPAGSYSPIYSSVKLGVVATPFKPDVFLNFSSSTGYQYGNGSVTPFKRWVTITHPNASEINVKSTVTWSTGPLTNETVTDEDHFYDWHP